MSKKYCKMHGLHKIVCLHAYLHNTNIQPRIVNPVRISYKPRWFSMATISFLFSLMPRLFWVKGIALLFFPRHGFSHFQLSANRWKHKRSRMFPQRDLRSVSPHRLPLRRICLLVYYNILFLTFNFAVSILWWRHLYLEHQNCPCVLLSWSERTSQRFLQWHAAWHS